MSVLDLKQEKAVFVLTMTDTENANTFTSEILKEYHRALDEVEEITGNCSLVLTSEDPKTWSTGINLEWLVKNPPDYIKEFAGLLDKFLYRWAMLSVPTVGCINGHAFAGGALMACALDFRLMRKDKGWFCFPEVDVKIPFSPLMQTLVHQVTDRRSVKDLFLTGRRIGGEEAVNMGFVDAAYEEDELMGKAMDLAELLSQKDRETYVKIKRGMRSNLHEFAPK
jgi:enoyl-CoA hydratase/carnithine racemase